MKRAFKVYYGSDAVVTWYNSVHCPMEFKITNRGWWNPLRDEPNQASMAELLQ